MRKIWMSAAAAGLTALLTACGTAGNAAETGNAQSAAPVAAAENGNHRILIAYFSYGENAELPDGADASASASIQPSAEGLTGNTGLIARDIQKAAGGTLFSIRTETPYPDTYQATVDQGRVEQQQNARPALSAHVENMADYDIIFLGYPNWWGDMPMPLYSFLDEYDLSGKTIIPFCTSGGSALSDTVNAIRNAEPDAAVMDGFHVSGSSAAIAEGSVLNWIRAIHLEK